jgi:SAM-dependent methyltransferase
MSLHADLRRALGRAKTRVFRQLGLIKTDWETSLPEEVQFWHGALSDPAKNWIPDEYRERTDPDLPFQEELRELLSHHTGTTVRILDVGAGPLTRLGKVWPGKSLEIVATDPLAGQYDTILQEIGLIPLVRTIAVQGEKLAQSFPPKSFDLAYASNSLDHAKDPVDVIRQMCALLKPQGRAYLWHFVNCGIGERYVGLHQWNFSGAADDMLVDDGRRRVSLQAALGPAWRVASRGERAFGADVVVTTIRPAE